MNILEACLLLHTEPLAPPQSFKISYFKLAKTYHPDVNKTESAKKKYLQVNEAYELCKNIESYDRRGLQRLYKAQLQFEESERRYQEEHQAWLARQEENERLHNIQMEELKVRLKKQTEDAAKEHQAFKASLAQKEALQKAKLAALEKQQQENFDKEIKRQKLFLYIFFIPASLYGLFALLYILYDKLK